VDTDNKRAQMDVRRVWNFLGEIDKLKMVERRNRVSDGSRRENTAEHSWHLGMATALLATHATEPVDVAKATLMAMVHDIVEIDAGDTFAYDDTDTTKEARERAAADRLFALLPDAVGLELRALWEEYERIDTPEARLVMAVDRSSPMMLNLASAGVAWREHGINRTRVEQRNRRFIEPVLPGVWAELSAGLDRAVELGHIDP